MNFTFQCIHSIVKMVSSLVWSAWHQLKLLRPSFQSIPISVFSPFQIESFHNDSYFLSSQESHRGSPSYWNRLLPLLYLYCIPVIQFMLVNAPVMEKHAQNAYLINVICIRPNIRSIHLETVLLLLLFFDLFFFVTGWRHQLKNLANAL